MESVSVHCLRFERQFTCCAFCFALASAGSSIAARIAMMAITTSSSISVNARIKGRVAGAAEGCPGLHSDFMSIQLLDFTKTDPPGCYIFETLCRRISNLILVSVKPPDANFCHAKDRSCPAQAGRNRNPTGWFAGTVNPCLTVHHLPTFFPGRQEFRQKVVHITQIGPPAKIFASFVQLNLAAASAMLIAYDVDRKNPRARRRQSLGPGRRQYLGERRRAHDARCLRTGHHRRVQTRIRQGCESLGQK